jgi:hypothetical protein
VDQKEFMHSEKSSASSLLQHLGFSTDEIIARDPNVFSVQQELTVRENQREREEKTLAWAQKHYSPSLSPELSLPPLEVQREIELEKAASSDPEIYFRQAFDERLNWLGTLPARVWAHPVVLGLRGVPGAVLDGVRNVRETIAGKWDEVCMEHESVDNIRLAWEDARELRRELKEGIELLNSFLFFILIQ